MQFRRYNRQRIALTGLSVFVLALAAVLIQAHGVFAATTSGNSILQNFGNGIGNAIFIILDNILMVMIRLFGALTGIFIELLIIVAQYNTFLNAPVVQSGWPIVRDLMNMVFIIALLIISAGTVLRLQNYRYNRLLGKLIVMAFLVNFSKFIAVFLLQFAQVVMLTFVNAFRDVAFPNFSHMFGLDAALNFANEKIKSGGLQVGTNDTGTAQIFVTLLAGLIMMIVAFVVMLAICIVLFVRIVALWMLIILSPIAYALRILPNTEKWASQWWSEFGKYVVVGPMLAFFLWISLALVANNGNCTSGNCNPISTSGDSRAATAYDTANKDSASLRTDFLSELLSLDRLITFVFGIIFLMMGLQYAQKSGGAGGAWAGKVAAGGFGFASSVTGLNAIRDRTIAPVQGWMAQRRRRRDEAVQRRATGLTNLTDKGESVIAGVTSRPLKAAAGAAVGTARALPGQVQQTFRGIRQAPQAARDARIQERADKLIADAKAAGRTITPADAKSQAAQALELEARQERRQAQQVTDIDKAHAEALRQNKVEDFRAGIQQLGTRAQQRITQGRQSLSAAGQDFRNFIQNSGPAATARMFADAAKAASKSAPGRMVSEAAKGLVGIAGTATTAAGAAWDLGTQGDQERRGRRSEYRNRKFDESVKRINPDQFSAEQRRAMLLTTTGSDRAAVLQSMKDNKELEQIAPDEGKELTSEQQQRNAENAKLAADLGKYHIGGATDGEQLAKVIGEMSRGVRNAVIAGLAKSNLSDGQREMLAALGGVREAFTKNGEHDSEQAKMYAKNNQDRMLEFLRKSQLSDETASDMDIVETINHLPKADDDDFIAGTKDAGFAKVLNKTMLKLSDRIKDKRRLEYADPANTEIGPKGKKRLKSAYVNGDAYKDDEAIIKRTVIGARGGTITTDAKDANGKNIKVQSLKALFADALASDDETQIGNVQKIFRTAGKNFTKLDYEALNKDSQLVAEHLIDSINAGALSAMAEKVPKSVQDMAETLHKWALGEEQPIELKISADQLEEKKKVWASKNDTIASRESTSGMVSRIGKGKNK